MDGNTWLLVAGGVVIASGSMAYVMAKWRMWVDAAESTDERIDRQANTPKPKWQYDADKKK